MTINTRSHAVMIIFNTENHGQFPQGCHVGSFPYLSLIGSTIPITGNGDIHGFTRFGIVLVSKGQSRSNRYLGTDNTLSTIEVPIFIVKVHTSTLSSRISFQATKQFSHHLFHRSSTNQCHTMTTIGGNPTIFFGQSGINARRNRFLAIVQVTKATNVASLVLVITGNFHATHSIHGFKHIHEFVFGRGNFIVGLRIQLICLERSSEIKCCCIGRKETM
mmetsp:Transcript_8034/g.14615  ORF Transcript_8034/g.14615 Transcript_8034/m.14615 type:complete len:219 (-) Transcript_8034:119-775(-)